MKIKKLNIYNNQEMEKWEDFVLKNGYIFQSYKWAHIIKDSYNFEPLFLYLENDNQEIVSLLPLFHVKLFPVIDELVSIPHFEAGGIINPQYHNYFLDYIKNNFKFKNLKIFQFKENIGDYPKNDINAQFIIDIPDTMEEVYRYLRKGFKRSAKNLIEKTDIEIIKGNSEEYVDMLYKFNVIKSKELGTPHHKYEFLKLLIENFRENCLVFVAKKEKEYLGASFIIFYNGIAYHIYHFVPFEYLKLRVGLILYAHVFIESFKREMKQFSYGRSPKGSGVYKFKTEMKATPYPLYIYNFNLKNGEMIPEQIKILSEKYSWVADIWSKLPFPITNFLSPKLRKWVY